jgi:MFS family permease
VKNATELTYHFERQRAVSAGIIESAGTTFLLLIAVRQFHAGQIAKALVAAGPSIGLFASPLVVSIVSRYGWPTAISASRLFAAGGALFLTAALCPILPVYLVACSLGLAASASAIPLLTQIYQENYPERERGQRFARTVIIRIGTAALFGEMAGRALTVDIGHFRLLLFVFTAAFAFASYCLARCPSRALAKAEGTHPFQALRFVRDDPMFRLTLICWMFMGFANLMMLPLRVEFLANPKYGVTLYGQPLEAGTIALLTAVIPNVARLILSPVWGHLFDRMNFFVLRVILNAGFIIGILAFFTGRSWSGLILGAIVFGISNAGGDVAWSLWVTKFAPPERVADYMSVHTFFTGIRGIAAPMVAFHLASRVSFGTLGWISASLIFCAILLLLPEIKFGRKARRASALVEEVSD